MVADTAAAAPLTAQPSADTEGPAEEHVIRLFARFVAAGYAIYSVLLWVNDRTQVHVMAVWWTVAAVALVFAPALVMGALSLRNSTTAIRIAAGVTAAGFVVAAVTWPLGWNSGALVQDSWISTIPGLAGLAAAIAWRPVWAVVVLVAAVVPVQLINHVYGAPAHKNSLVADLAFALAFSLLYVAAAVMAMRTGRELDRARDAAYAVAAAAGETQARDVHRKRFALLIHDWVLDALLAAPRGSLREEVRVQAQRAIDKLADVDRHRVTSYTGSELAAHLRTAVTATEAAVTVTAEIELAAAAAVFPAEPVEVIGAAVGQAVRNSVLHAGSDATRQVSIEVRERRFVVVVADDGAGFDPAKVAPHRLGLAVSIIGRIEELPGGEVQVRTRLGAGTVVAMAWQAT